MTGSRDLEEEILEGYEDRILDQLGDDEELEDVVVAARILAQAHAGSRSKGEEKEVEDSDIEWALVALCIPLWPKKRDVESAIQVIRPALVRGLANHGNLPAEIPEDISTSSSTLLDLKIKSPTRRQERIKTLLKRYSPEAIAFHIDYRLKDEKIG